MTQKKNVLESVTGGWSGNVPEGGIKFIPCGTPEVGKYYSADQSFKDVIYVTEVTDRIVNYNEENFVVEGNAWSSNGKSTYWKYTYEFSYYYPYQIDVTY